LRHGIKTRPVVRTYEPIEIRYNWYHAWVYNLLFPASTKMLMAFHIVEKIECGPFQNLDFDQTRFFQNRLMFSYVVSEHLLLVVST
jgi:hypothetical protein